MKKVFIGSSTQALEKVRILEAILMQLDVKTTCWIDDSAFALGHNTIDNLIRTAQEHSAGIFLLDKDDKIVDEDGSERYVPRDNVLVEAGIFAGVLGKESVVLCTVQGVHETSDFKGITRLDYDYRDIKRLKKQLEYWLERDVKDYRTPLRENNLLMLPRQEIHERYPVDERFHISDKKYKHIKRIRLMNFASNLLLTPEVADKGQETRGISLRTAVQRVLEETAAIMELILAEPTPYSIRDIETKVSNRNAESAAGVMFASLAKLFRDTTDPDALFYRLDQEKRFHFCVMEICMPFAILNVEFSNEFQKYNHVKVDLYSAALGNEDDRRSFVIWQEDDPQNYQFFVDNFNQCKLNTQICRTPEKSDLEAWAKEWERIRGKDTGGK